MSKTDEIRAMLDARGAEYETDDDFAKVTSWADSDGREAVYIEFESGSTSFEMDCRKFAPAQAVAATLGPGTCEVGYSCSERQGDLDEWTCSECGREWWQSTDLPEACPWCRREVTG